MSYLITKAALHQNGTNVKLHDGRVVGQVDITVTVAGGKFVIDGTSQGIVSLQKGNIYYFDQSEGTNANHPLRLSTTSDGTHGGGSAYTTGVTTSGTPGSAGAYTMIDMSMATPDVLYYYCSSHSGMGGSVQSGSVGVLISQNNTQNRVGIGTTSPSHKFDVNGDIRIRGNNIRDSSGNEAITFDGSANTIIDQNFTVRATNPDTSATNTITLNGVSYIFPSSDGSSGQFLSTDGSGNLSFATASGGGGGGGETSSSYTLGYSTLNGGTSGNVTGIATVPSGKTIRAITAFIDTGFINSYGSGSYATIYYKIGNSFFRPLGTFEQYGSINHSNNFWGFQYCQGTSSMRMETSSSTSVDLYWSNQSDTLTAGSATIKVWYA